MTALSREQAAHFEGLIDAYEQQREDAQAGLKETLADLREKLAQKLDKPEIAAEVAGLRGAVKRRRMERTAPEKAAKAEEKQDLADQYYFLLQNVDGESIARTHSALGAKPVTPHDRHTGEIIEQNPEPGAGVESMGNGGQAEPAETMLEPNLGYAAGRTAEEDIASPEGGRPSPLAVQVHKTIGGAPLKPAIDYSDVDAVTRQRQADTPDIPSFLKRANTGQAGRA